MSRRQGKGFTHVLRRATGQALIIVSLALPVFFSLAAVVVDGSNLMVHRRSAQNAADAAALAVAQSIDIAASTCTAACSDKARDYAKRNGVDVDTTSPSWHQCIAGNPADTNCWAYPYVDKNGVSHNGQVEVRLRATVTGLFTSVVGLGNAFSAKARAVANTSSVISTSTTTIPGTTNPGTTIPGQTITSTSTSVSTVTTTTPGNAALFAFGTVCGATHGIVINGNNDEIRGLAVSNAGATLSGNNKTLVDALNYKGPNNCTLTGASHVTTATTHSNTIPWPKTWDGNAICNMAGVTKFNDTLTHTVPNGANGIYCALNGTLAMPDNGTVTLIAKSVIAGAQTITLTAYFDNLLIYQTQGNFTFTPNNSNLTGWMWVPNGKLTFGGNSGSRGFYEALDISIQGNSAVITGDGPLGGTTTTSTSTSTSTTATTAPPVTVFGTTNPGSTSTTSSTVGTTIGLDE